MERIWQSPQPRSVPQEILETVGGNPLISKLLLQRNIRNRFETIAFLDPHQYTPSSSRELPGMDQAADIIIAALEKKEKICIWGDFDVDGQTSTALLVQALLGLNGVIDHYIPIREKESHGINIASLENMIRRGAKLIVTCDTGISANPAIDFANQQGVKVVITDHHELPESLPEAAAIINPHFLTDDHPLSSLPGVGVAFKLIEELYHRAERSEELSQFLDLVALGIVADVASLKKDTRYLAQMGIIELRNTNRLGLQKLYELAELNPAGINEEHIGFVIGPRLNALGRLSDANKAVEFFTTTNELTARLLAIELEGLNAQRQLLTSQVFEAALSLIDRDRSLLDHFVLVLGHPAWPAGVIGIVASRLAEQFGRPVILLSNPPGEFARGSARSIPGIDITAAISTQKELLRSYGGHAMAAGISILPENIDRFKTGLSKAIAEQTNEIIPSQPLEIDAEISLKEITLDLVTDIERLAPFGAGNPPPTFLARNLHVEKKTIFGRSGEHMALTVKDSEGTARSVVWWQGGAMEVPESEFDLAFTVHASTYLGQSAVQLEWLDARAINTDLSLHNPIKEWKWVDYRDVPDPINQVVVLRDMYPDLLVWAEGEDKKLFEGKDRLELFPSANLAIASIPPSRTIIEHIITHVKPETLFLFAHDPGMDAFERFLKRLAGLVLHTINKYNGIIELDRLAAACAQRQDVIKAGLDCLSARGVIHWAQKNDTTLEVTPGDKNTISVTEVEDLRLKLYLSETKAFRKYYRQANPAGLL